MESRVSIRPETLPRTDRDVVFQPVPDGAVLLSTRDEIYYGLNNVGARIWELLPPALDTLPELLDRLGEEYPQVDPETLRTDVIELLRELEGHGLVRSTEPDPGDGPGEG